MIFKTAKEYKKAFKCFRSVLEIEPNNSIANYGIARVYQIMGENDNETIEHYLKCIKSDPTNIKAYIQIGIIYLKNKNLQLTTDHAKYSYFNYSIVTKKTKTKKPILENKASDGAITFHPQFGRGIVTQIINKEKHLIKVEFEKYGEKILKHDHSAVFFFA